MTNENEGGGWSGYNSADTPARPRLLMTLQEFTTYPGVALDLGAGSGSDTLELLRRGWTVDAVDGDLPSLNILRPSASLGKGAALIHSKFEELDLIPDSYDLINASFSLPFCKPDAFAKFWSEVVRSLKRQGIISFEVFGWNDDWSRHVDMTFHSLEDVRDMVEGMEILILREEEYEKPTRAGENKHWHLITCIARKTSG